MDILRYKGYEGTAEIDIENLVCYGKVLFIDDVITYKTHSLKDLQKEFEAAIDDYLETCKELGRNPKKPVKGQFNVRLSPEQHRELILLALKENSNLNEMVSRGVNMLLESKKPGAPNNPCTVPLPSQNRPRFRNAVYFADLEKEIADSQVRHIKGVVVLGGRSAHYERITETIVDPSTDASQELGIYKYPSTEHYGKC